MKKRTVGIAALVALLAEYLLLRYPLLQLHGMKEWPLDLVIAALVVSGIAVWVRNSMVPLCAAIGYAVGFAAGYFFQTSDPVKMTNNLWIIWTLSTLGFIVLGVILSAIVAKRQKSRENSAPDDGEGRSLNSVGGFDVENLQQSIEKIGRDTGGSRYEHQSNGCQCLPKNNDGTESGQNHAESKECGKSRRDKAR